MTQTPTARRAAALAHVRGCYGMVDLPDLPPDEASGRASALGGALLAGGVTVLQLRMKTGSGRALLAALTSLRALCGDRATLVLNDRLDVALAGGADGVHLGQDDLPLAAARAIAPPHLLIGISTHDEAQAEAAETGGADYIGFGPIFATRTKENPDPVVGLARLASVCGARALPVVGIGGIDLVTVEGVAAAGAAAAALIAAVNGAPDPVAAARAVGRAFTRAR